MDSEDVMLSGLLNRFSTSLQIDRESYFPPPIAFCGLGLHLDQHHRPGNVHQPNTEAIPMVNAVVYITHGR